MIQLSTFYSSKWNKVCTYTVAISQMNLKKKKKNPTARTFFVFCCPFCSFYVGRYYCLVVFLPATTIVGI